MAIEAFLINPSKVNPPKRIKYRRRKRNPIGETLVTIGSNPMRRMRRRNPDNPWYGDPGGHRIAALMRWGKIPRGRVRRHRKRGRPRVKYVRKIRRVKHRVRHRVRHWVVSKRRRKNMARRKRRKSNTWFGQPRRHRKAARKGWRRGHMIGGGGRRRRVRHRNYFTNAPGAIANPRRRRRHNVRHRRNYSRRRRNPAIMAEFGKFTSGIMNVREWAPLAVTGGLSAITGAVAPSMIGVDNPWMRLGVQTAVAIGGGIVVERFVDRRHGQAWMIVGVAMVGYQLLKQFVFVPYFPQFAVGLGSYQDYYPDSQYIDRNDVSQQVGAFPQLSAYPGVGGDEVGAYPYDGAGY